MDRTPDAITHEARFFLEPAHPRQRQYEALRAYFASVCRPRSRSPLRLPTRLLSHSLLAVSPRDGAGLLSRHPSRAQVPAAQGRRARTRRLAAQTQPLVYDIRDELERSGTDRLSVTAIQELLREEGFARLPRRLDEERPTALGDGRCHRRRADVLLPPGEFSTHAGGLFLLLPLLARLDLDTVVRRCAFPGTKMIPAAHAVRAALLLKLLGKSRRSHVMDLVFDPGVALAAGLNAIPKATFMSQYSSRLGRKALVRLLGAWIEKLRDEKLVDASSFDLDFHSISYFGEDPFVEKHYVPRRSQRRKAVLAFLARDAVATSSATRTPTSARARRPMRSCGS